MTSDRERIEREIARLERELETPISAERRRNVQDAIRHLQDKKNKLARFR